MIWIEGWPVYRHFLPVVDGVGRVVSHYAQGLGERCEACYVITPGHGDVELQNGSYKVLGYRSVPLPRLQQYRLGFPMLDAGYRPDWTHCSLISPMPTAPLSLGGRLLGMPAGGAYL